MLLQKKIMILKKLSVNDPDFFLSVNQYECIHHVHWLSVLFVRLVTNQLVFLCPSD